VVVERNSTADVRRRMVGRHYTGSLESLAIYITGTLKNINHFICRM